MWRRFFSMFLIAGVLSGVLLLPMPASASGAAGKVRITLSAAGSGERLIGASYAVYGSDNKLVEEISAKDIVTELELEPGDYALVQEAAPAGYLAERARIAFQVVKGRTTMVEITGEADPAYEPPAILPKTGEECPAMQYGFAALLIGIAALCGAGCLREKR